MNTPSHYTRIKQAYKQQFYGLISNDEYCKAKRGADGRSICSAIHQARIELKAKGEFVFL